MNKNRFVSVLPVLILGLFGQGARAQTAATFGQVIGLGGTRRTWFWTNRASACIW